MSCAGFRQLCAMDIITKRQMLTLDTGEVNRHYVLSNGKRGSKETAVVVRYCPYCGVKCTGTGECGENETTA